MKNSGLKQYSLALILVFWLTIILAMFFVVQKPDFFSILPGLWNLVLIILVPLWMALLSACIGSYFLEDSIPEERLILGSGTGMGIFGLAGFGLAILGWAKPMSVLTLLIALTVFFLYKGKVQQTWKDIQHVKTEMTTSLEGIARWIPVSAGVGLVLAFLMGLTPPIEDFDALTYHLTVPVWWLKDGGLVSVQSLSYWYPHLVEGSFVFPIVFGVDTSTHLIHLFWLVLVALLLWLWAKQAWNHAIAWDSIAILLSMPTLLWLASWAYTDYALTFTGMASLYSIWKWQDTRSRKWISISGILAGLAMGVKYTSFIIPLVIVALIILWGQGKLQRIKGLALFSLTAGLVASPWYIRNWVWMRNPFYPFAFGGRYWDTFLAQWFSGAGSGIGFNFKEIFLLPVTAMLGIKDTNYFDGRFGPMLLILLPLAIWAIWQTYLEKKEGQQRAFLAIIFLSLSGIAFWVIGVVSSDHLFQARYLFPSLITGIIPLSVGLNEIYKLDTSRLKISFIFRLMLGIVVLMNLFNFGLFTIIRNPIAVAAGMISRQQYVKSQQPEFAGAVELVNHIPNDSKVYILFEPRSYGVNVFVEPDVINSHFPHDVWLYATPEKIIASWVEQGYTHVLIRNVTNDETPANEILLLQQTESLLVKIGETPQGDYALYKIP
ncbi:MAG: glycosyltransferase family 39 protein [Chloroflexi bacterium]|nr:glycosyltransferase family 39 protein [Chloroflexota bacterium]